MHNTQCFLSELERRKRENCISFNFKCHNGISLVGKRCSIEGIGMISA